MDLNETLDRMYAEVHAYCVKQYEGKTVDYIFAATAAEMASAEDSGMRMFHELCFRHILQDVLEKREEHLQKQIDELKEQLEKMAKVIDILNQDGASK